MKNNCDVNESIFFRIVRVFTILWSIFNKYDKITNKYNPISNMI
jgi:hypothetical protein